MSELPQDFPSRDGDRSSLPSRDGDRSSPPSRDGDFPSRDGDRSSLPSRDGDLPSRGGDFPSRDGDRSSLPSRDDLPSRGGDFPSRDGDRSSLPSRDGDRSSLPSRDGDFPSFGHMHNVLEGASYNWFELVEFVEEFTCDSASRLEEYLHSFYSRLVSSLEEPKSVALLEQSFKAFRASASPSAYLSRMAATLNGEVVSESDCDNADDYVGLLSIASPRAKKIIEKKRKALALRVRRAKAKAIASKNVLAQKVTSKVKTVVDKFPDIGKTIETFVQDCNVGADAWRRTGVLTFDGNRRIKMKATFQRIRTHLEETYNHKFSYGTVVQLCVPRNLRHRAAKNYRGVAKVTCRRSRKGFELRYNPDSHWSRALYKGLNYIELTDGSDITIINRDDASGYRLDTLFTNRQHRTPAVQGHQALTTHTDYVNKYPSIIQTTSYNFTGTKNTGELCAGVVKAQAIYPKNPAQHYADLNLLSVAPELQPSFLNPQTNKPKLIECARVDGASDEGPSHDEVMFWWTSRHLECGKLVTLLTSRCSGSNFLNRVELQNGCLSLGHSNLFIPSTLNGACIDQQTGKVDREKLRANMESAMEVYIDRVNGSPCGDTVIHLFKGADSTQYQDCRQDLQIFLEGSKVKKEHLQKEKPAVYSRKYGMLGRGTWCQDCLHSTFFYWCVVSLKDAHTPYARISNLLRCHGFLVVPASDGFQHLYLMSSDLGAILVVILALASVLATFCVQKMP